MVWGRMIKQINHDRDKKIIRLYIDSVDVGYLTYEIFEGSVDIQHTVISQEHRGKGYGKVLVDFAIDVAESCGLTVTATCSYADQILNEM